VISSWCTVFRCIEIVPKVCVCLGRKDSTVKRKITKNILFKMIAISLQFVLVKLCNAIWLFLMIGIVFKKKNNHILNLQSETTTTHNLQRYLLFFPLSSAKIEICTFPCFFFRMVASFIFILKE
jgi:hypothetical protein